MRLDPNDGVDPRIVVCGPVEYLTTYGVFLDFVRLAFDGLRGDILEEPLQPRSQAKNLRVQYFLQLHPLFFGRNRCVASFSRCDFSAVFRHPTRLSPSIPGALQRLRNGYIPALTPAHSDYTIILFSLLGQASSSGSCKRQNWRVIRHLFVRYGSMNGTLRSTVSG